MPPIIQTKQAQRPLVIIPCGGKKLFTEARASDLYIGGYFKIGLETALLITSRDRVLILSAKYGLVGLDDILPPYEMRMGQPECITVEEVRDQAEERGLIEEPRVIALGGRSYTRVCRAIWPTCKTPLEGVGGIGKQMGYMKKYCRSISQTK